jgi:hypothetical protein
MMVGIGSLLLGLLVVRGAGAAPPAGAAEAFLEGNRLYQEGDYAGAVSAYESVLSGGYTAAGLEYNLANAYLKDGSPGKAILHYRRALLLEHDMESARANLAYARSLTQDVKPEATTASFWDRWSRFRFGPERAALAVFLAFTAFWGLATLRLFLWRDRGGLGLVQGALGGLTLLLAAALVFEWNQAGRVQEGVVLAPEVEVRTGPAESYTVSFRLHEGTEVEILRTGSGWQEIKVSDRLRGWAPSDAVAPIRTPAAS